MKKQNSIFKNIPIYITLGTIFVGVIAGYIRLQAQSEITKEKVDKNEEEINEVKEENEEIDKAVEVAKKEQENISKQINEINIKQDKIYDLLLDIKNRKK